MRWGASLSGMHNSELILYIRRAGQAHASPQVQVSFRISRFHFQYFNHLQAYCDARRQITSSRIIDPSHPTSSLYRRERAQWRRRPRDVTWLRFQPPRLIRFIHAHLPLGRPATISTCIPAVESLYALHSISKQTKICICCSSHKPCRELSIHARNISWGV